MVVFWKIVLLPYCQRKDFRNDSIKEYIWKITYALMKATKPKLIWSCEVFLTEYEDDGRNWISGSSSSQSVFGTAVL